MRDPDAAWMSWRRWNAVPHEEQKRYGRVSPEFVIEMRSESDRLSTLQEEVRLWSQLSGAGVAARPATEVVEVYRPGEKPEVHEQPTSVQGSRPVARFQLVLERIWS